MKLIVAITASLLTVSCASTPTRNTSGEIEVYQYQGAAIHLDRERLEIDPETNQLYMGPFGLPDHFKQYLEE